MQEVCLKCKKSAAKGRESVGKVQEKCDKIAANMQVKCRESARKVGENWTNSKNDVLMELFKIT